MIRRGRPMRCVVRSRRAIRSNASCTSSREVDDDGRSSSVLFLSPSNWPEPDASAAGTRTTSLLDRFARPDSPFDSVHFGCGAKVPSSMSAMAPNSGGAPRKINWHAIPPNRGDEMKRLLERIRDDHGPVKAVVFDRFHAEEAYSFRVRELCPGALLVLDMQDVHSLRLGRQRLVEEHDASDPASPTFDGELMDTVMRYDPSDGSILDSDKSEVAAGRKRTKAYDSFLRELASIHRSDLVLVCSSEEAKLLESWNVPQWKMVHASFFCDDDDDDDDDEGASSGAPQDFEGRRDFVSVGGFKHPPNVDSVELLRRTIWPRIRTRLPRANLHVYGARPSRRILSMRDEGLGFRVHGHVEDLDGALVKSRAMLAPLRFGAGNKGKIIDAWRCGVPVITTSVGAEGMTADASGRDGKAWGGMIANDADEFVESAVRVYEQREEWSKCQIEGRRLLKKLFSGANNLPVVESALCTAMSNLDHRRRLDFVGAMLWRDGQRSTEYFSKFLELKEIMKGKT